jgi:hypothetical protein
MGGPHILLRSRHTSGRSRYMTTYPLRQRPLPWRRWRNRGAVGEGPSPVICRGSAPLACWRRTHRTPAGWRSARSVEAHAPSFRYRPIPHRRARPPRRAGGSALQAGALAGRFVFRLSGARACGVGELGEGLDASTIVGPFRPAFLTAYESVSPCQSCGRSFHRSGIDRSARALMTGLATRPGGDRRVMYMKPVRLR